MDLFKPSNKILEVICSGEKNPKINYNPLISYEVITGQEKELDTSFISGLCTQIEEYYRIDLDEDSKRRLSRQKVGLLFSKVAKNCIDHSPTGKEIFTIGFFFGNNGVCYGFQDGGLYFKYPEIQHQYENKIKITEFNQSNLEDACQLGVNHYIYPYSDIIEVDIDKGVLYCVQLKDNIVAPPGKDGNEFFLSKS